MDTDRSAGAAGTGLSCDGHGTGDGAAPGLFIVRIDGSAAACRWEIRRFGAIVLSRSATPFPDAEAARRDGEEALARWPPGTATVPGGD